MFRASSVPIIRSYQLYMWQLVCFMQVMWPLPRRVRFQPDFPDTVNGGGHTLYTHWTDFYEILYTSIFRKSVEKIQVSLKSDKNDGYFT